jgi:hypothetical protein
VGDERGLVLHRLGGIVPAPGVLPNRGSHNKREQKKPDQTWLGPQVFGLGPTSEQLAQTGRPTGQRNGGYGASQQVWCVC